MRIRETLCVALALLMLLAGTAAADTSFSFRNGVTWSTTVRQMLAAEGMQEGSGAYNEGLSNGFVAYYLKDVQVYYVFSGDRLVMVYILMPGDAGAYAAYQSEQTAMYGMPADIPADTISALLNRLYPNSFFSRVTAWRLSDGTLAALLLMDGEIYMTYINEQRILGG